MGSRGGAAERSMEDRTDKEREIIMWSEELRWIARFKSMSTSILFLCTDFLIQVFQKTRVRKSEVKRRRVRRSQLWPRLRLESFFAVSQPLTPLYSSLPFTLLCCMFYTTRMCCFCPETSSSDVCVTILKWRQSLIAQFSGNIMFGWRQRSQLLNSMTVRQHIQRSRT